MDVFNGNLETIETSCFSYLHLSTKSLNLAKETDGVYKKPYIDSRAANHINKLDIISELYAAKKLLPEFLDLRPRGNMYKLHRHSNNTRVHVDFNPPGFH